MNSKWADIRISDYPNRIRLFLGLPSPMLCNQIYIRTYPYPTKYPTNIWLSRVDPQLSSKIEHMLHSSAELWANPGLDKFGNDFHWWFLGTFCLLKEFLKKKISKKNSKFRSPMNMKWKWKKKFSIWFQISKFTHKTKQMLVSEFPNLKRLGHNKVVKWSTWKTCYVLYSVA